MNGIQTQSHPLAAHPPPIWPTTRFALFELPPFCRVVHQLQLIDLLLTPYIVGVGLPFGLLPRRGVILGNKAIRGRFLNGEEALL
jgi:hypothetical protein